MEDKIKCPTCGKIEMSEQTLENYRTRMRGIPFIVPQAKLHICGSCEEEVTSAREMRRWETVQRDMLREEGLLPKPAEVREFREKLGFSKSQLALFCNATISDVSAWEDEEVGLKISPEALLIQLLIQESKELQVTIFDIILQQRKKYEDLGNILCH